MGKLLNEIRAEIQRMNGKDTDFIYIDSQFFSLLREELSKENPYVDLCSPTHLLGKNIIIQEKLCSPQGRVNFIIGGTTWRLNK